MTEQELTDEPNIRRNARLMDVFEEYPLHQPDLPGDIPRYALVEESSFDLFVSLHSSPEEAADYHDGQESVEDWDVLALFDLDSTDRWIATSTKTTTFHRKEQP